MPGLAGQTRAGAGPGRAGRARGSDANPAAVAGPRLRSPGRSPGRRGAGQGDLGSIAARRIGLRTAAWFAWARWTQSTAPNSAQGPGRTALGPHVQVELPEHRFLPLASGPVASHQRAEPGSSPDVQEIPPG